MTGKQWGREKSSRKDEGEETKVIRGRKGRRGVDGVRRKNEEVEN